MPQEIAAQRAASLDKHADPLASIGLPQAHKAPMGQGFSAQRGSSPIASMPGIFACTRILPPSLRTLWNHTYGYKSGWLILTAVSFNTTETCLAL